MAILTPPFLSLSLCCMVIGSFWSLADSADSISANEFINGTQTLVSSGEKFVLGFFSDEVSNSQFLGIWYYKILPQTVVWVANRENPDVNSSSKLSFDEDGNLVLLNQTGGIFWSSNSSTRVKSPVAKLLDSGNLVIVDSESGNSEDYSWQSFDFPSDTLLPGMKLGWDLKLGFNREMRSWKSPNDPSPGNFSYSIDLQGLPQVVLLDESTKLFRSGPWIGTRFSGGVVLGPNTVYHPQFMFNSSEAYYTYDAIDDRMARMVVHPDGLVQQSYWDDKQGSWIDLHSVPSDRCDKYAYCGHYGLCSFSDTAWCSCLRGFTPRNPQDWGLYEWSEGCVRKDLNICGNGEGFVKISGVKLPDAEFGFVMIDVDDCEAECLKDCSCKAYARLDSTGTDNSCLFWSGDLVDIRTTGTGQDLYIRAAASELEPGPDDKRNVAVLVAVIVSAISAVIFVSLISWFFIKKRRNGPRNQAPPDDLETPLFDIDVIEAATQKFSLSNKIGEGGFGPVYKGKLQSGQEVAVKRLSESSGQGVDEFKNEVLLISQLQHRNLVQLLGCCIHREERMLIYEYMPNKSLDHFIFDDVRRCSLDWKKRKNIIVGIARGLLYLHRDSRLRIIHRDFKASNILLDEDMNPKISDFGMARMFAGDETATKTKRVVGTYGYMSPEYAIDGYFSFKSDVFSFGVVLVEMVSGRKNRGFFHPNHQLNLIGHAWKLWKEGRALELLDVVFENKFPASEALKLIQIGLLCVQQRPEERPMMSTVVLMLDSDNMQLPEPGRPGFYAERSISVADSSPGKLTSTSNEISLTLLEPR